MTRDDIIRMADEACGGRPPDGFGVMFDHDQLERFVSLVAAAEREACAKACEELDDGRYAGGDQPYGIHYARAIRARNKHD